MNEARLDDIPDKEATAEAPLEAELELVGEEPETLEEDASEERAVEADMSRGGVELRSTGEIELEEDENEIAR